MNHQRALLVAVLVAAVLTPAAARAGDPSLRWFTLTTPHFYVHYYRNVRHDLRAAAQKVAAAAEQSHVVLTPLLRHAPRSRTHIVVTDDTDGANGSAQIVPYNVIRVFVTGPDSLSALNDYDDWIYGLVIHEYTHILHIDTIHGLPRVINAILGKSWAPNQLQPRWFIEGLATYQESERTAGGRVRGTIFDMLLRMAVLEGKLLEMDQISSATRNFPRGTVPYLYGGRFVKYIADRFGDEKLARISHDYGGQMVPYAINRIAERVLGHRFVDLYADFKRHLRQRYELQLATVQHRGMTRFTHITTHGESVNSLRYSPDGTELIYAAGDGRSHAEFRVLDAASARRKQSFPVLGGNGIAITPDGRQLVLGQSVSWRTFYGYQDLYVRDRQTRASRRLTSGLRARDPDVSPDGRSVVFVTNDLGSNDLALIPLAGGRRRVLLRGKDGQQVFTPRFSPDGTSVVFSRWMPGGKRDIFVLELATARLRRLTDDRALDVDPVYTADGRHIYFSSDRTGIFNIYRYDLRRGDLRQVTNVIGGAFTPAISPDEQTLYYVGFSARGYDLHRMELDVSRLPPALPYVNDRPAPPKVVPPAKPYAAAPYEAWRTIYPRSWLFNVGSDASGSTFGIELTGGDVVGRHRYSLATQVRTAGGYPAYAVNYAYDGWWPGLRLDTARAEGRRGGLVIDGEKLNYTEENYAAGLSLGLPVLRIPDHNVSLSAGYRFNWFRNADGETVLVEPGMLSPKLPATGKLSGLTFGVSYRSVQRYVYSVSNQEGRQLDVNFRVNHAALGSDFDSVQVSWVWSEYVDIPWWQDHVLALRLAGGIGRGDSSRRGLFFIGGFPEQNLIDTIIDIAPMGGAFLRGYAPGSFFGDQFHLLNVEYRLPLFDIERGMSSLPLYFNHVHLAAFGDVGNAFFNELDPAQLKVGVGAEVLLEWMMFYVQPFTLRVGYARGLMDKGGNQYHILIGNRF